jgi:hypothetical protein
VQVVLPPYPTLAAQRGVVALLGGVVVMLVVGGGVLLGLGDAGVVGTGGEAGTDEGLEADEEVGAVTRGGPADVVVQGVVSELGVVMEGVDSGVVSTEVAEVDGEGVGGTVGLLGLLVGGGIEVLDVTWVRCTVEVVVVDMISVVLHGVVLEGGVPTGIAAGVVLVSQEVSLCFRPPGAARTGPMAAKRKIVASIASIVGILWLILWANVR